MLNGNKLVNRKGLLRKEHEIYAKYKALVDFVILPWLIYLVGFS